MAKQTAAERLQTVANETSGTTMTISPKEGKKWTGYLLQQKQNFEGEDHDTLCNLIADHIEANREKVEITNRQKKPFKYQAK